MRAPGQPAPVQGIERAGYRLVWRDTPNAYDKARMAASKGYDLTHSLGLTIDKDGVAGSILWNGPAFRADIVNGTKLVAVDGVAYSKDRLETRSEEHTSELHSLMRNSYAVICLQKK